jgi:hypothetical protein
MLPQDVHIKGRTADSWLQWIIGRPVAAVECICAHGAPAQAGKPVLPSIFMIFLTKTENRKPLRIWFPLFSRLLPAFLHQGQEFPSFQTLPAAFY